MIRWLATTPVILLGGVFLPFSSGSAAAVSSGTQVLFVAPNGSDGSNTCTVSSMPCASIGHALAQSGTAAIIDVASGSYDEHGLIISNSIEIDGAGSGTTVIDAGHKGRAIQVQASGSLTIEGITIRNGKSHAHAGAIQNSGTLALVNDRLIDNSAVDPGGAIVSYTTITELENVRFVGDSTQSYGGAVTNFGNIDNATADTFTDNFAENGAGAIENQGTISSLDGSSFTANRAGYAGAIDNSGEITDLSGDTFWANNVSGYGGALNNVFGTIGTVTDDTFVGNSVNDLYGQGGAIEQDNGTISTLADDTITGNSATIGGGIDNEESSTVGGISGVIVALNTGTEGPNCYNFQGQLVDAGYNLENDAAASCGFSPADHDLVGVDPDLRVLGDYGGANLTEPPLSDSPAINAGPDRVCPTISDERGVPRPQGAHGSCDMGAVEVALPNPTDITPSTGPAVGGTKVRVTGRGFTLTTQVRVGQTPVRFRVIGDTAIDFTTPPGQGTELVTITDTDGRSTRSLPFSYVSQ
jgi:hypothetical protein